MQNIRLNAGQLSAEVQTDEVGFDHAVATASAELSGIIDQWSDFKDEQDGQSLAPPSALLVLGDGEFACQVAGGPSSSTQEVVSAVHNEAQYFSENYAFVRDQRPHVVTVDPRGDD